MLFFVEMLKNLDRFGKTDVSRCEELYPKTLKNFNRITMNRFSRVKIIIL